MAAAIFLVTRTAQGVNDDRNLVREVVIHNDDADADALIIQNAVDALNTQHPTGDGFSTGEDVYPVGYFDTVVQIGASPVANLAAEFDFIAYAPAVSLFTA